MEIQDEWRPRLPDFRHYEEWKEIVDTFRGMGQSKLANARLYASQGAPGHPPLLHIVPFCYECNGNNLGLKDMSPFTMSRKHLLEWARRVQGLGSTSFGLCSKDDVEIPDHWVQIYPEPAEAAEEVFEPHCQPGPALTGRSTERVRMTPPWFETV